MITKYIYIDDEQPETVRPYIEEVKRNNRDLRICLEPPASYKEQVHALSQSNFDGLILDLRLDQFVNWKRSDSGKAYYRATTLAQEIRTRATEGKFREYPVVLWSTDQRLRTSFTRDDTGHDLFDMKCIKEEILEEQKSQEISTRLVSLSRGYNEILKVRAKKRGSRSQFHKFLGFSEDPGFIDPRIIDHFEGREGPLPAHEYARFILRDLLEISGPLIDDQIMAARLGIDINESEDFNRLKESHLKAAEYKGPFKEGWPRWWAFLVEKWWRSLVSDQKALRSVSASERVETIKKVTKLRRLVSASPIEKEYSEYFWTICQCIKRPLDPRDGLVLSTKRFNLWQDRLYVSLKAALSGEMDEQGFQVDPLEREKFKRAKATLTS